MLKFFQKIRKSLLVDKKVSQYAIGEIILVVIGILIALQINNWNQERLNTQEEKILIESISEKINYNQFQYKTGLSRYNEVIKSAYSFLSVINSESKATNIDEIESNLHSITKRWLLGKANSVSIYDQMIGAGQLNILSSEELRSVLTSLKENLLLLESYEDIQINFLDNQLTPFLNLNADVISIYANGSKNDTSSYDQLIAIDYSSFYYENSSISYEKLLINKEFSNLLFELVKHRR